MGGAVAGSIISEIGKGIQQDYTNVYSARQTEENQRRAIKANERMYRHRWQWQIEDMIKAGINPILAAGGSPPSGAGAPAPSSGATHSGSSAIGQNMNAAKANKLKEKLDNQQMKLLEEQIKKVAADTRTAEASAQGIEYENVEKGIYADFIENLDEKGLGMLMKFLPAAVAGGAVLTGAKTLGKSGKNKIQTQKARKEEKRAIENTGGKSNYGTVPRGVKRLPPKSGYYQYFDKATNSYKYRKYGE